MRVGLIVTFLLLSYDGLSLVQCKDVKSFKSAFPGSFLFVPRQHENVQRENHLEATVDKIIDIFTGTKRDESDGLASDNVKRKINV